VPLILSGYAARNFLKSSTLIGSFGLGEAAVKRLNPCRAAFTSELSEGEGRPANECIQLIEAMAESAADLEPDCSRSDKYRASDNGETGKTDIPALVAHADHLLHAAV